MLYMPQISDIYEGCINESENYGVERGMVSVIVTLSGPLGKFLLRRPKTLGSSGLGSNLSPYVDYVYIKYVDLDISQ